MIHLPFVKREYALYNSRSRILDARKGRWLTHDPLAILNPQRFLETSGNWRTKVYANDDPVNFVDPSGYWGVRVGVNMSAQVHVGGKRSAGIAVSYSKDHGFQVGHYSSIQKNLGTQVGLNAGMEVGFSKDIKSLKDFEGKSYGTSGGLSYKVGLNAEVNYSRVDGKDGMRDIVEWGGGFDIGAGVGISGHKTETNIIREFVNTGGDNE